jgi:pSer/pThr/pTyr-binding forkhead associated (FHA) protein
MLVLVLLFAFLYLVVQALRRDLRAATVHAWTTPADSVTTAGELCLELIEAGQTPLPTGQDFPLSDPLLIGRAKSNHIALDDDWISAQHVRLHRQNGAWLAEDLGSTNGTRVNGNPLTGAAQVEAGDVLDLGRVKFKLVERP